jgi:stage IV sporulation protein FB
MIVNFKKGSIIIYPFGGLTVYNEDLNVSINKELFVLLGGITFQVLFFLFIFHLYNNGIVTLHVFNIFKKINLLLVGFNFLPILPLDGGKLINLILDKIFSYRLSNIYAIIISIIFIIIFSVINKTFLAMILTLFLIKSIVLEIYNLKYKYNKFLLERYLRKYKFKKIKFINNEYKLKRDYYHIIGKLLERDFLANIFDKR